MKTGTSHFSQLAVPPKVLTSPKETIKQVVKDSRHIITSLKEPLEAVELLENAPEGTFFYMQTVENLKDVRNFKPTEIELINLKKEYDILVVPHDIIELTDYFTISKKGVTHISETQHSFTEIHDWLDELVKLQKLRAIPLFKNFRLWKPMKILKKAVTKNRQ